MKDAIVRVNDPRGKRLGDHDLVLEMVLSDVPPEVVPREPLSCEVKLRRLWSRAGRKKTRAAVRKESCDDLGWWLKEQGNYGGRLILMAIFPERAGHATKADDFVLCADLKFKGQRKWTSLFGWDDAVGSLRAALMPPPPPRAQCRAASQAKTTARAKPHPKAKARARATVGAPALRTALCQAGAVSSPVTASWLPRAHLDRQNAPLQS